MSKRELTGPRRCLTDTLGAGSGATACTGGAALPPLPTAAACGKNTLIYTS